MSARLRELPLEERIKLVEDLWDSIAAERGVLPLTEAQRAELDLRLAAYEADKSAGRSPSEVLRDIRNKL
jgi:putative addiction module component (TIGR02574 family)